MNKGRMGGGGGGVKAYLHVRSVKKNCLILKQQAEFFVISCFAIAKYFLFWA